MFPLRLPFGLVLWRGERLAANFEDVSGEWYERGVLHAEIHHGRPICDCRNRETKQTVRELLRIVEEVG